MWAWCRPWNSLPVWGQGLIINNDEAWLSSGLRGCPPGLLGTCDRSQLRVHTELREDRSDLRPDRGHRDDRFFGDHVCCLALHELTQDLPLTSGQLTEGLQLLVTTRAVLTQLRQHLLTFVSCHEVPALECHSDVLEQLVEADGLVDDADRAFLEALRQHQRIAFTRQHDHIEPGLRQWLDHPEGDPDALTEVEVEKEQSGRVVNGLRQELVPVIAPHPYDLDTLGLERRLQALRQQFVVLDHDHTHAASALGPSRAQSLPDPLYTWCMTRHGATKRLLIAVEPRLLADTLARALGGDYDVLVADTATWQTDPATAQHFDAAIVTNEPLPPGTSVERLLVLEAPSPSPEVGVLRTVDGDRTVAVGGLSALVAALDGLETPAVGE